MFARLVRTQFRPADWDAAETINRTILAAAHQQHGFKGYLSIGDRVTGVAITISRWETEADREASGQGSEYLRAQLAKLGALFTAPPVVENYEVVVDA